MSSSSNNSAPLATSAPAASDVPGLENTPTAAAFRGLIRTFGLLRRVMEPYFAQHGISGAQWGILRTLLRAQDEGESELRLVDLSARLFVRPPSITSAIGRLEKMDLVSLASSPTDQRVKLVKLTPSGRKLLKKILAGHGEQMRRVLGPLSDREQTTLSELLTRVSDHLENS